MLMDAKLGITPEFVLKIKQLILGITLKQCQHTQ